MYKNNWKILLSNYFKCDLRVIEFSWLSQIKITSHFLVVVAKSHDAEFLSFLFLIDCFLIYNLKHNLHHAKSEWRRLQIKINTYISFQIICLVCQYLSWYVYEIEKSFFLVTSSMLTNQSSMCTLFHSFAVVHLQDKGQIKL